MVIYLYEKDFSNILIDEFEDGDIIGYKFTFTQLIEYVEYHAKETKASDELLVLASDRLGCVFESDFDTYIEMWHIQRDKKSKTFKFHQCCEDDDFHSEKMIAWSFIQFFKGLDFIKFAKEPTIVDVSDEEEDGEDE